MSPGDFAIVRGSYTTDCRQIERVTSATVYFVGRAWPRQARFGQIVFAGPESVTNRLHDQLKSSAAQLSEDTRAAALRKEARDESFIKKAMECIA